jgi:hypothetical protein
MDETGSGDRLRIHAPPRDRIVVEIPPTTAAARPWTIELHAVEEDVSAPRVYDPGDGPQKGRFAVTIWAEQSNARAAHHLEVDLPKDLERLVPAVESADVKEKRLRHRA